jgi:hypothetical protein
LLVLTAKLAARLHEAVVQESSLEVEAVVGGVLDEHLFERELDRLGGPATTDVPVEMIGPDVPTLAHLWSVR